METLRGLLALLCVVMAGAQTQDVLVKFKGKFAEVMLHIARMSSSVFALCCLLSGLSGFEWHTLK